MSQTKALPPRQLVILGYGSIARGLLAVIQQQDMGLWTGITVLSDGVVPECRRLSQTHNVMLDLREATLARGQIHTILDEVLEPNDIVVNLTSEVGTEEIFEFCQTRRALYLDTSNETWADGEGYENTFERRQSVIAKKPLYQPGSPTALVCHGANPGLVTHFLKVALLEAASVCVSPEHASNVMEKCAWGELCRDLGIHRIDISEIDTQKPSDPVDSSYAWNTWSLPGFIEECLEPACHAIHPKHAAGETTIEHVLTQTVSIPIQAAQHVGKSMDIMIDTWLPSHGWASTRVIPHVEPFSMAELCAWEENGKTVNPSIRFAYRPCDLAVRTLDKISAAPNINTPDRILMDEITTGVDELGITLFLGDGSLFWFGSSLSIDTARQLAPDNNATTLQVVAGVWSGLVYCLRNPTLGLVEPEDIDHHQIMALAKPYLGRMISQWVPAR